MSDLFKGFEQLLELAKLLEEKAEKGELQTNVQINTRPLSSIPRQGNRPTNIGTSRIRPNSPASAADDPVIITPPPKDTAAPTPPEGGDRPPEEPPTLQDVGGLGSILQELRELVRITSYNVCYTKYYACKIEPKPPTS